MKTSYYDFRFGGEPAGYFEISESPNLVEMNARFQMEGQTIESPFSYKLEGNRVTAYRSGDGEWQTKGLDSASHYPTCAYPLLVKLCKERLEYTAVKEGDGSLLGTTELVRDGNTITERREGKVIRTFTEESGVITRIDWGGPVSRLCASKGAAVKGTAFEKAGK